MRKVALWTTYLYFFICPLEFIFNRYFGSSVKYVALVAAAFILMFFIGTPKQKIKISSFQICIILWAMFEAASFLWTIQTARTLDILVTYLMMAVLVFAISIFPFTEKEFESILTFYAIGALILSFLVLIFGQMDEGSIYSGRLTLKILGAYQDPNDLGASLLAPAFYSLYRTFKKGNLFWNIFFAVSFMAMSVATLATGSRGALVAYAFAILVFVLMASSKKGRLIILVSVPFILIIAYLVLRSVLDVYTFNRLFDFGDYTDGNGRIRIWLSALSQIIYHPFLGQGIASHMGYFLQNRGIALAMHNSYLAMLFEVGLVGLALFFYPTIKSLFYAAKKKNGMICAAICSCMLAAFFLDALLVRYLWNAIIIAMLYYNVQHSEKEKN